MAHLDVQTVWSEIFFFFFHHLLLLPYSGLVLVSGKVFLPGGKENHQHLQAYTDLYQGILEKSMSFSFSEIMSNPQRTLKSVIWITCWWRSLTIDWQPYQSHKECGRGRSQGKRAFVRRKESGDCPSSGALPATLNLNHLPEPLELISISWTNGKRAPHLAPSYCCGFCFVLFWPTWRTDFNTLWTPTTWMSKICSSACNDSFSCHYQPPCK